MSLNVGHRLGHYDVTALNGEGRMGKVYQATDHKPSAKGGRESDFPKGILFALRGRSLLGP